MRLYFKFRNDEFKIEIYISTTVRMLIPPKKNLEKYWSLSKMICSSVRLKVAKEKVYWHVCKGVRKCVWMYLYSMETNAKLWNRVITKVIDYLYSFNFEIELTNDFLIQKMFQLIHIFTRTVRYHHIKIL